MTVEDNLLKSIKLPGYSIKEKIGRTSHCILLRAHQEMLARDVMIKLIPKKAENSIKAIQEEIRLKFDLPQETIATSIDEGETGRFHYFVVELSEGTSLAGLRRRPTAEILTVLIQLFQFLADLHERGFCAGACMPQDFRITPEGHFRVLNLENTLRPGVEGEALKLVKGMEVFLAPEVLRGNKKSSPRADLFLFGALCYYSLYGVLPFGSGPPKKILQCMQKQGLKNVSTRTTKVFRPLDNIIKKLLSVNYKDRPKSAREVVRELERISQPLKRTARHGRKKHGVPWIIAIAIISLAVAAGTFIVVLRHNNKPAKRGNDVFKPVKTNLNNNDNNNNLDNNKNAGHKVKPTDSSAKEFNAVLARNEERSDDWQDDIKRLDSFISKFDQTEWASRARFFKLKIRENAEKKAKEELNKIDQSPGRVVCEQRIKTYLEFAKKPAIIGTSAAKEAIEKAGNIKRDARKRVGEVLKQLGQLCAKGLFKEALSIIKAAEKYSLPEGKKLLEAKAACIVVQRKEWDLEETIWIKFESEVRTFFKVRKFDEALRFFDSSKKYNRPELIKKFDSFKKVSRLSALAFDSLISEAEKAMAEKRTLVFRCKVGDKEKDVSGKIVSVEPNKIRIKQSGRTTIFSKDPLMLKWSNLLMLIAPHWEQKEPVTVAVIYLLAVSGYIEVAEKFEKTVLSSDVEKKTVHAFLLQEKDYKSNLAINTAEQKIASLKSLKKYVEAERVLIDLIKLYSKTETFKKRRVQLLDLFNDIKLGLKKGTVIKSLFNAGNLRISHQNRLVLEYTFRSQEECQDWKAANSKSLVQFVKGGGVKVTGRASLLGNEPVFTDWLRVDGYAFPLCADPPNCNFEFWGGKSGFSLFFGLGFEDKLLPVKFLKGGKLFGPTNVLFAKLTENSTWHVLYHSFSQDTKLIANRSNSFIFADLKGDMLIRMNGKQILNIPRAKVQSDFPDIAGKKAKGGVTIDTRNSPVIFRSITISGGLNPGWMETAWKKEIMKEFNKLCDNGK